MTVDLEVGQIDRVESFKAQIEALSSHVHCSCDATKLDYARFLAAKAKRYQSQNINILADKLLAKITTIIQEIRSNIELFKSKAESCLALLEEESTESYDYALTLFDEGRYQLVINFYNQQNDLKPFDYFKKLRQEITGAHENVSSDSQQIQCDDSSLEKQKSGVSNPSDSLGQYALHSFKHYQSMFERMALDRLLSRVMKEIPENAGPLNPERLVIKTFKTAQDISPVYLSSLISYYESLLTLQVINTSEK